MPKIYQYIKNIALPNNGLPGQFLTIDENNNKIWTTLEIFGNQIQADWNQLDPDALDFIKNKPNIPTQLSQLTSNSDYRTVTDVQITNWNDKADKTELHEHVNKTILDKITEIDNKPLWNGVTWPINTTLNALEDVNITSPIINQVLRFNPVTSKWINSNLDDVYVRPNEEVIFERLFVGDGTTNTDKYIYAHTGAIPVYTSPSLRYKIDDHISKIGHWEFSNDGENFGVIGQSDFIADTQHFDNVAHNDKCIIDLLDYTDSSYHRLVSIYCKEQDPLDIEKTIWVLYPTSPNFEGVGFNVTTHLTKTEITNLTGITKDIRVIIQYLAPDVKTNKADISDINGLITLWKDGVTRNTNQSSYFKLYEGSFFVNFARHEQILNIGLIEFVNLETSLGNCRIEISDGINTIVKEVGAINNTQAKHTNIRLDCGFLDGNLKRWTILVYGKIQNGGIYTIRRLIIKSKPTTIASEDFVIQKTPNINIMGSTYLDVDQVNFYGGYKVNSDTFLSVIVSYTIIGEVNSTEIQLETKSGLATRTATASINVLKNIEELRVRCPATLENLITLTMRAKVSNGSGSIQINNYSIYVEM